MHFPGLSGNLKVKIQKDVALEFDFGSLPNLEKNLKYVIKVETKSIMKYNQIFHTQTRRCQIPVEKSKLC